MLAAIKKLSAYQRFEFIWIAWGRDTARGKTPLLGVIESAMKATRRCHDLVGAVGAHGWEALVCNGLGGGIVPRRLAGSHQTVRMVILSWNLEQNFSESLRRLVKVLREAITR
jgi:hypothetical protein